MSGLVLCETVAHAVDKPRNTEVKVQMLFLRKLVFKKGSAKRTNEATIVIRNHIAEKFTNKPRFEVCKVKATIVVH